MLYNKLTGVLTKEFLLRTSQVNSKRPYLAYNKGIRDAGSTADFRILFEIFEILEIFDFFET